MLIVKCLSPSSPLAPLQGVRGAAGMRLFIINITPSLVINILMFFANSLSILGVLPSIKEVNT